LTVKVKSVVLPSAEMFLHDHIDIDRGIGERAEDRRRDAGTVRDLGEGDLRLDTRV